MNINKEQSKHLAETARVVAIAQFAAFGYTAVVNQQYSIAILSTLWFVAAEWLAVMLLEDQ
ncbi:MAG: hypothetical protein PHD37_06410 [Gallionellaceae bacterium]|nr:hypothetical protein [Gallionellaceae bacterium]